MNDITKPQPKNKYCLIVKATVGLLRQRGVSVYGIRLRRTKVLIGKQFLYKVLPLQHEKNEKLGLRFSTNVVGVSTRAPGVWMPVVATLKLFDFLLLTPGG